MTGKEEFIKLVDELFKSNHDEVTKVALDYFEWFKSAPESKSKAKTELSDKAKAILEYMQTNKDINLFKAKSIADEIGLNSRAVSGSMRKLISDGYVYKVSDEGVSPAIYSLKENN